MLRCGTLSPQLLQRLDHVTLLGESRRRPFHVEANPSTDFHHIHTRIRGPLGLDRGFLPVVSFLCLEGLDLFKTETFYLISKILNMCVVEKHRDAR